MRFRSTNSFEIMPTSHLEENLTLLKAKDPVLARLVSGIIPSGAYEVSESKSGPMTLSRRYPDQSRKFLHSAYNPRQEAERFIDNCQPGEASNFLITGMGLGYHILELIQRVGPSARILVFEKDAEVFRLALECNDMSPVITHPGISFHVERSLAEVVQVMENDRTGFILNGHCPITFKPLVNCELSYYSDLGRQVDKILRETHINLNTQAAFSKIFYKNIIHNWESICTSPGVNTVAKQFSGHPAIIISAGPSLDKNVGLLKAAADRALLICVGTALKPLLQNGVCPDFVMAIDAEEINLKAFDIDTIPPDLCLVYDPCVPNAIPKRFANKKLVLDSEVSLSIWLRKISGEKGSLGKIFSVAHTALLFAQYLGCDPIILVGQDLSFAGSRLHCTGTYYNQAHQDQVGTGKTLELLQKQKHEGYAHSLAQAKDLFGQPATTTLALDVYKECFVEAVNGPSRVYNATEGGIPIPSVGNVSLREALTTCCREDISSLKRRLLATIGATVHPGDPAPRLKKQADCFRQILNRLKRIKSRRFASPHCTSAEKSEFVLDMEVFYREFLQDETTVKLMQGYDYSGFIQWNQENNALTHHSNHLDAEERQTRKFERDRKFLDVATESALFLCESFDRLSEKN